MDKDIKDTTTAVTIITVEDVGERSDAKTLTNVVTKAPNVIDAGIRYSEYSAH